jgi:hypothetical protein
MKNGIHWIMFYDFQVIIFHVNANIRQILFIAIFPFNGTLCCSFFEKAMLEMVVSQPKFKRKYDRRMAEGIMTLENHLMCSCNYA